MRYLRCTLPSTCWMSGYNYLGTLLTYLSTYRRCLSTYSTHSLSAAELLKVCEEGEITRRITDSGRYLPGRARGLRLEVLNARYDESVQFLGAICRGIQKPSILKFGNPASFGHTYNFLRCSQSLRLRLDSADNSRLYKAIFRKWTRLALETSSDVRC